MQRNPCYFQILGLGEQYGKQKSHGTGKLSVNIWLQQQKEVKYLLSIILCFLLLLTYLKKHCGYKYNYQNIYHVKSPISILLLLLYMNPL